MRYRTFRFTDDAADDDIEDAYGFALDMDGITGVSSPSRRVSFTTSSERDRPFVRPPAPPPLKPHTRSRMQNASAASVTSAPATAHTENSRLSPVAAACANSTLAAVAALPQEAPRRPTTPPPTSVEVFKQEATPEIMRVLSEPDGDVTPLMLEEADGDIQTTLIVAEVDVVEMQDETAVVPPTPAPSRPRSRLPSEASSRLPSLAPSVVRSRASTPSFAGSRDIEVDTPSSPLSSPPRSLADADELSVAVGVVDEPLSTSAPASVANASRASSVARTMPRASGPPRKRARLEGDADVSAARPAPQSDGEAELKLKLEIGPVTREPEARRAEKAKPIQTQKPTQKKRRRVVVWSDDESEAEGSVSAPAPAAGTPVPESTQVSTAAKKRKDKEKDAGERKRAREEKRNERTKKARAKDVDGDIENEPLQASSSGSVSVAVKSKSMPKPAGKRSAAPTSATNMARPGPVVHEQGHVKQLAPEPARHSVVDGDETENSLSGKSKDAPSPAKRARCDELPVYTLPLPAGELEGMLIETLATARASSLATSTLYSTLMAARPALRGMALPMRVGAEVEPTPTPAPPAQEDVPKDEKEQELKEGAGKKKRGKSARADADAVGRGAWVPALESVLEAGWRRCGVFGKVVNCGTDTGDQELALEARWFYDPDRDEDRDRAALVRTMMRRPGKRSETKKAKQYYWRPLPKISRWDPEDEL
ncbi:hypothetical protein C8Q79DRAFT_927083 [Trametes meyenii]|nr:hypothetical protein C8Q79DRAFT_927083 [Trametes meyenii]